MPDTAIILLMCAALFVNTLAILIISKNNSKQKEKPVNTEHEFKQQEFFDIYGED